MISQLLSFLLGVALASAWWALTVLPHTADGWEWAIPILMTVVFILVFIFWCLAHSES